MSLPQTGELKFSLINTELSNTSNSYLTLGSSSARALANVQSGTIRVSDFYGKSASVVYIGLSTISYLLESHILALPAFSITYPYDFSLNAGINQYQYFACPVDHDTVDFLDRDSQFAGGWDGAHDNGFATIGPRLTSVSGQQYRVYRTDFSNLGVCNWRVRLST
jgi:hypothetical protein